MFFNLLYTVAFDNVADLVSQNPCQLVVGGHEVEQSLENIDEAARHRHRVHFVMVQHLEGILQVLAAADRDKTLADAVDMGLQLLVLNHAVFCLKLGRNLLAHRYFLILADQRSLAGRLQS